jgi:hypothetical protein
MYVNKNIADETCTDSTPTGPRPQQERSSDALLPKPCSSKSSPRPSYRQFTKKMPDDQVLYTVTISGRSTGSQPKCTIPVRQLVIRIHWIEQRQVSPPSSYPSQKLRELDNFTKDTFHCAWADSCLLLRIRRHFHFRAADWD